MGFDTDSGTEAGRCNNDIPGWIVGEKAIGIGNESLFFFTAARFRVN